MKPSPFFWGMEFDANLWQIKFELVMLVDGSEIRLTTWDGAKTL